ncbi:MAG: M48 family metalloprotease [Bacteroidetes bacterium]|nr:M48 family metalloprotease [Bacteroidota bacterium]
MPKLNVKVSPSFRSRAIQAVLAIVLFIVVYLLLIVGAIGLTVLCCYLGVMLIALRPSILTLGLGAGIISVGFLILYFLVKFLFKKHEVDSSHLKEITREEQPELFAMIQEIVDEVETDFPKRVYLSADVNASVFYNSSFWSMFLPVRKNLQIGMGLVNSVTVSEFKAILAHEFGHFSQSSMKVGSYVYNVNQVIYNMLYDNSSFSETAQSWANVSGYIAIFVKVAIGIIEGIQWILGKVYNVLNISYMSLSREMEFHADEIAANVAGSQPLVTSLQRLEVANVAYDAVLEFYNARVRRSVLTNNLYPQHAHAMLSIAKYNEFPVENGLPQVAVGTVSKFNKSKLVVKDQWASHPSTSDRAAALNALNKQLPQYNNESAKTLFRNVDAVQQAITEQLFAAVNYQGDKTFTSADEFMREYDEEVKKNAYNDAYNNFYNNRQVELPADLQPEVNKVVDTLETLYSDQHVDLVYTANATKQDMEALRQIQASETGVKSFDYDGVRYKGSEVGDVAFRVEKELEAMQKQLEAIDRRIFNYFSKQAEAAGKQSEYLQLCAELKKMQLDNTKYAASHNEVIAAANMFYYTLPIEVINREIGKLRSAESLLKTHMKEVLQGERYKAVMTEEEEQTMRYWSNNQIIYFDGTNYNEEAIKQLFDALRDFARVSAETYTVFHKHFLDYQIALVKPVNELVV